MIKILKKKQGRKMVIIDEKRKKNQRQLTKDERKPSFFLCGFSFTNIHQSQDCRERGGHFFNSSLPFSPSSQTLTH